MRTGVDHQSLTDLVHHSLLQVDVAAEDGGRLMCLDPAPKLDAAPVDEAPIPRRQRSPGRGAERLAREATRCHLVVVEVAEEEEAHRLTRPATRPLKDRFTGFRHPGI